MLMSSAPALLFLVGASCFAICICTAFLPFIGSQMVNVADMSLPSQASTLWYRCQSGCDIDESFLAAGFDNQSSRLLRVDMSNSSVPFVWESTDFADGLVARAVQVRQHDADHRPHPRRRSY